MIRKIHTIKWAKRWNKTGEDLVIKVVDEDCIVTGVNHKIAKWGIGEYWYVVCRWFEKHGAVVTLGEEIKTKEEDTK